MVEHMDEPAIGLLHVQHTHRQSFEQRQVLSVAREFGVLHQGQQADGIAAQLDLVAGVDQEGCLPAIRQRGRLDQAAGEVLERPVDGLPVAFVLREFPALEQGVGRAGMAQRVVGRDGFVEAGEPAVLVFAAGLDLACKVVCGAVRERADGLGVPVVYFAVSAKCACICLLYTSPSPRD